MQVVRDKIANIWAATVTLKYCPGRQSQLCPTIPLSTCTIPIFQSLIFQYWLNCDCILSFSSPHIPILIATEKAIDPSPCYKTATQSNAAVKTNWQITDWNPKLRVLGPESVSLGLQLSHTGPRGTSLAGTVIRCLWHRERGGDTFSFRLHIGVSLVIRIALASNHEL